MYAVASLNQRAFRLPYAAPQVDLRRRELDEEPALIAFAVLGLVALAIVLAWGAWCVLQGGSFYFSYQWPTGFIVWCYR
jgi:hypothetical protein